MAKKGKAAKKVAKKENKKAKKTAKKVAATKKVVVKKSTKSKPVAKKAAKKVAKAKAPVKKAKVVKKVAAKPVKKVPAKKAQPVKSKKVVKIKQAAPKKPVLKSKPQVKSKKEVKPVAKKAAPVEKKLKEAKAPVVAEKKAKRKQESSPAKFIRPDYKEAKIDLNRIVKHTLNTKVQTPAKVNTDTRTRYSDAELVEFKEIIVKKLAEARKDYEILKDTLSHKDDHGTDDTSPSFKLLEDGSEVLSKEETSQLASRQQKFIEGLENALVRIENKTYGICRATGKLISKERLRIVPHATLSIEAKREQV
jgi:RNA polymerase-binding transcription factor DksA